MHITTLIIICAACIDTLCWGAENNKNIHLIDAIKAGESAYAQALIAQNADPNTTDKYGKSALVIAAERNDQDTLLSLLSKNATIQATDLWGKTALVLTAKYEDITAARALIHAGVSITTADRNGQTALNEAIFYGRLATIILLIDAYRAQLATEYPEELLPFTEKDFKHFYTQKTNESVKTHETRTSLAHAFNQVAEHIITRIRDNKDLQHLLATRNRVFAKSVINDRRIKTHGTQKKLFHNFITGGLQYTQKNRFSWRVSQETREIIVALLEQALPQYL